MRSLALIALLLTPPAAWAQGTAADYERAAKLRDRFAGKLLRDPANVTWSPDGNQLRYEVDAGKGKKEFVVANAADGVKIVLSPEAFAKLPKPSDAVRPTAKAARPPRRGTSPDGKWRVTVAEHNLTLTEVASKAETALTKDGTPADGYTADVFWSPDSKAFVAYRRTPGGDRRVTLVESSPKDQLQPKTSTYFYLKPGDDIPQAKPVLFNVATKTAVELTGDVTLFDNPWDLSYEHWSPDSKGFTVLVNPRGHQSMRLLRIDAATGQVTAVIHEACKTFFDYSNKLFLHYLDATNELLWMSERSGWNHLYLLDATTGRVKNALTSGEWNVRGVEGVDAEKRRIRFRTVGYHKGEDPYHVHHARVDFDGGHFTRLTEGDGTHTLTPSPDRRYLLDRSSRVDSAPVTQLRTADGKLVATLETADLSELTAVGWIAPERFCAKGRDGTTDIYGVIHRPTNFDPAKKYRVIESIYAGPHDHFVPKSFQPVRGHTQALAELGFVVVQLDGMGTNWRGKVFHDVCYKNLGDAGLPDRVAWIRSAAARYPHLDVAKGVGIYGGSAGGQSALRALLTHGDFYTVAVADCGCHDNRVDKIWWNELWMGWPVGPHYAEQSNVTQAKRLTGKLLLIVGELDRNVDPSSTMQVANALVKADKDFDLLVIPGAGHGSAETAYGSRRRADFFVRHLAGVEPRR